MRQKNKKKQFLKEIIEKFLLPETFYNRIVIKKKESFYSEQFSNEDSD